ncbi:CFEM domain-containing protein [Diaporthe amygdali]|uniref:CFEM domain-containing protein n=1 Tax=Phomopsis amygdali TaxID=1214568 RepID=UPI0022FF3433|nr:CFEM domain-containing protein [Diaporthe amygdali]KAJ0104205.1 CFEM domain-containing protein [Diaporthe amygdali]
MDYTSMPSCGLECLVASLSQSACSSTNETCLCLDKGFNNVVESCVAGNCTIRESLTIKNITATTCGLPVRNQTVTINVLRYVLFLLGLFFFAMRLASRAMRLAPWGHDDTTIVISGLLAAGWLAGSILEERYGLGRDLWTLEPWRISEFLKVFFVFEVLYTLTLGLIKTSILFLYLRLFPEPKFRRIVWATQAFNFLMVGSFIMADFFQCQPISYFWESWDGEHSGHCFNINALAWAHSALNIALDFWMLYLPATQIWSLQMKLKKKLGVILMFGIGIFLTLTSIIRIQTLVSFANTKNPTRGFFATVTWSYIEITVGVMVACLPGARLFVARYVSVLHTTNSKASKSLSRSGNCIRLSQSGENDGIEPLRAKSGSGPGMSLDGGQRCSVKLPPNCARLPSSSESTGEDQDSQLELIIMTLEGDRKRDDEDHPQ